MTRRIHFISGLPRAGSTLLAAILRQNPRFSAGIETALCEVVCSAIRALSAHEASVFVTDEQRQDVLTRIVDGFYAHLPEDVVVFDTSRMWISILPTLVSVCREARVICCLRDPAWILDSIERLVAAQPLSVSRMFNYEVGGTVYSRADALMSKHLVGPPLRALMHAWHSDYAFKLIGVRYESLASRPDAVIEALYDLDEPAFDHDFERISYDQKHFDTFLGLPSLHCVRPRVEFKPRETILPPQVFAQYSGEFWLEKSNQGRVVML